MDMATTAVAGGGETFLGVGLGGVVLAADAGGDDVAEVVGGELVAASAAARLLSARRSARFCSNLSRSPSRGCTPSAARRRASRGGDGLGLGWGRGGDERSVLAVETDGFSSRWPVELRCTSIEARAEA